ncbi:hypothetical protein Glove_290g66 [Diversispora epigaea]|uniref:TLDc domain-containing protein n=1 Tax=Diversispora epigaea TaxID=1348612 RepID=A0A397I0T2_9GLOM|nr:hypothetical protein Glove_290g66 [Diversispora epigaea]
MKSLQEFTFLHESDLVSILKIEDLQMNELEIWGTSQNSTIPESLEEWSDENFITLKVTLQQCLPLIRYFHNSNSDLILRGSKDGSDSRTFGIFVTEEKHNCGH